jgi:Leucine-rich repeat (LRR) protein
MPVFITKLPNLVELRLIDNRIQNLSEAFYNSRPLQKKLEVLILNNNPLTELKPPISQFSKIEVLGLANANLKNIPQPVCQLSNIIEIYVDGCPLEIPPLALARRGIEAIREFFNSSKADDELEKGKTGDMKLADSRKRSDSTMSRS